MRSRAKGKEGRERDEMIVRECLQSVPLRASEAPVLVDGNILDWEYGGAAGLRRVERSIVEGDRSWRDKTVALTVDVDIPERFFASFAIDRSANQKMDACDWLIELLAFPRPDPTLGRLGELLAPSSPTI